MVENLSKHILTTIIYYDVMDYPLTSFEIWKYLTVINDPGKNNGQAEDLEEGKIQLKEIVETLENEKLKKFVEEHNGFYFLRGRSDLVEKRIRRNKISETKYPLIEKTVWWLRFVPYVRMIGVTGRMAMKNAERESDLDLLIVLRRGKIFTGRTLVTFLVHFLGRRRYGQKIADRICLNYFITTDSLEITPHDLFSASEYSFIWPLFGWEEFEKFQDKNSWMKRYKKNFQKDELANLKLLRDSRTAKFIRKIGEKIFQFEFIEQQLKSWETKKISENPLTKKPGNIIVAKDTSLIFLPEPQGPQVFETFKERLNKLAS